MGCGPPPPPAMADTADATPETIPPTSAAGGDSTDSAPPAPRAKPPSAEPRISPKPLFGAGGVAAAGVMTRVSIPFSSLAGVTRREAVHDACRAAVEERRRRKDPRGGTDQPRTG